LAGVMNAGHFRLGGVRCHVGCGQIRLVAWIHGDSHG